MRHTLTGCCAVLAGGAAMLFSLPVPTRGDGLIYRLPEDGAWVKYYVHGKGAEMDDSAEFILRSVGKATADGEACRWIEMEIHTGADAEAETIIQKFLIPEAHLKAGKNPSTHVRKWWTKRGDQPVQAEDVTNNSFICPFLICVIYGQPRSPKAAIRGNRSRGQPPWRRRTRGTGTFFGRSPNNRQRRTAEK